MGMSNGVKTKSTGKDWLSALDKKERAAVYETAMKKVGTEGTFIIAEAVREKIDQRNQGNMHLRRAFHFFDRDSSSSIDIAEFSDALASFGLQFNEDQILALFATYDRNNTGCINYTDFTSQVSGMDGAPRGRWARNEEHWNM